MQLRKTLFALRQAPCVALLFLIVPVCLVWSGGVHRLPGAFIADFGRDQPEAFELTFDPGGPAISFR